MEKSPLTHLNQVNELASLFLNKFIILMLYKLNFKGLSLLQLMKFLVLVLLITVLSTNILLTNFIYVYQLS